MSGATNPPARAGVRSLAGAIGMLAVALVLGVPTGASARALRPAQDATTTTAPVQVNAVSSSGLSGEAAINDLTDCIQATKHLAVVFLIDQSGSLGKSDPDNRRVDAAKAALDSLASLTQGAEGERAQVDATFAAFSNTYYPVRAWTTVTNRTLPSMVRTIEGFRKRNQGTDTDFVTALGGAREELADHSAEVTKAGDPEPCKAIVLFTDGQYDIGVRDPSNVERLGDTKPYAPGVTLDDEAGAKAAEDAGRRTLCDVGGLADGYRGDDITLLTVALTGSATAKEQDFLSAVSTGASGAVVCGKPTDRAPGAYVSATNVGALVARFDEIATRVAGGTLVESKTGVVLCGEDACPEGTRRIKIDRSVRRLRILALAPKPGLAVELISPSASTTISEAGSSTVGAASVQARSIAGRGFGIDIDRPEGEGDAADWNGTWQVVLHDTSGTQVGQAVTFAHYLFTDVGIAFVDGKSPELTRGATTAVAAQLVIPKGSDTELARSEVRLRLDDPLTGTSQTVPLAGSANGPYVAEVEVPASFRSNVYVATLELEGTTTEGAVIEARSVPQQLLVKRPKGAIQFGTKTLQMPTVEGTETSTADLIVFGGDKDGCIWFGPSKTTTAPEDAGALTVSYEGKSAVDEDSCIEVAGGETKYVSVEVKPQHRATGAVRGQIEVHEKTDGSKPTVTDIGFRLDMAAGIDQARRLLLAIGLLLGGLVLPLLLLILINAVTARFQDLSAVQGAVLPVRVDGARIWRNDGGRWTGFFLKDGDFESLAETGDARQFTFGGIVFRARPSRNPFGASLALAAPEGGAEKLKGGVGSRVELDLGLSGSWIFLLDPDRTRAMGREKVAEGSLIAFIAEGDVGPQIAKMNPDLDKRLPGIAADLASLVRETPVKPAKPEKPAKPRKGQQEAEAEAAADVEEPVVEEPVVDGSSDDLSEEPPDDDPGPDDDEPPAAPLGFTGAPRS